MTRSLLHYYGRDTINLLNPAEFDRHALVKICKRRLFQKKKKISFSNLDDKEQLEDDLRAVFKNKLPRKYGEPILLGVEGYERLAPGTVLFNTMMRQKRELK